MTDFLRNILVTAAAANATATATSVTAATATATQPVNQIQIPPAAVATSPATSAASIEKQRLIKVEVVDAPAPTADASKAQRAARRDVVNARRDKRKAMASVALPSSPLGATSGGDSSAESDDDCDKSKKMKTSATSSVAVAGGLAASETKKSFSASMPPTPGLLFTPEIDAAGEERLRAMEAQLETLDPDSKEAKKKRRLIRNRMSAQLHRERKKAYVGQLEDQLLEKDRELKLLQEKLAKLMAEKDDKPSTPPPAAAPVAPVKTEDVVIKEEPQAWDTPAWALDSADAWDLHGLEDSELEAADLLRDFDDPFAGLGDAAYADLCKPHPEIHAAKKNLAMMAAVMFSVSFFGNSPAFYNVTPGSNFSSTFSAHPPKDLSQMSIASRIVACLDKTSWKEFRSVSSWISSRREAAEDEAAPCAVASPSAASDVTSCGSPAPSDLMGETDLIDALDDGAIDDPLATAATADWLDAMDKDEPAVPTTPVAKTEAKSLTSRLYESLTALWREKNQVLLTVRDDKDQVLKRSVADMSTIRDGLESGNFFTQVFGADHAEDAASSDDKSVTFLYPMSAFAAATPAPLARAGDEAMFLEVSCQLNGGAVASRD